MSPVHTRIGIGVCAGAAVLALLAFYRNSESIAGGSAGKPGAEAGKPGDSIGSPPTQPGAPDAGKDSRTPEERAAALKATRERNAQQKQVIRERIGAHRELSPGQKAKRDTVLDAQNSLELRSKTLYSLHIGRVDLDADLLKAALELLQTPSADAQSRRLVCEALQGVGGEEARDVLVARLKTDSDPSVRAAAATSLLGFRGDAVAEAALREAATADSDPEVRAAASAPPPKIK